MSVSFADLFSGCGGFSLGFRNRPEFIPLAAADSWATAGETYLCNFPGSHFITADLSDGGEKSDIVRALAGKCDILLGGPPCQGFSTLGKRRDGDERSTLVDHFADMASRIEPKIIILENVRGITSKKHPAGGTYADSLIRRLESTERYTVSHRLVHAQDYGLAQTRVRWILIAVRKDVADGAAAKETFWNALVDNRSEHKLTLREAIGDLPDVGPGEGADEIIVPEPGGRRLIYNHKALAHSAALVERLQHVPAGGGLLDVPKHLLTDHLSRMVDGQYGSGGHIKNIYGRLEWDKPCGTIVAGMDKVTCGRFVHPEHNRLLTPRECARIQSFPDWFRFRGGMVAQYYQIGNAVPPRLSSALAEAVLRVLQTQLAVPQKRTATRAMA